MCPAEASSQDQDKFVSQRRVSFTISSYAVAVAVVLNIGQEEEAIEESDHATELNSLYYI